MDISENETSFMLYIDAPGMKKEDIDITVQDNRMIITGKRRTDLEAEGSFYYTEHSSSTLHREVLLPPSTNIDKISSIYQNGVIIVTIGKNETDQNQIIKKIPVE